jgi:hypothetical protein
MKTQRVRDGRLATLMPLGKLSYMIKVAKTSRTNRSGRERAVQHADDLLLLHRRLQLVKHGIGANRQHISHKRLTVSGYQVGEQCH